MHDLRETIAATVRDFPLCGEIVAFFLDHNYAMDTARGIADWWLRADLTLVQEALDKVVACGVVVVHTKGGKIFYSFTQDADLHSTLREHLAERKKEPAHPSTTGKHSKPLFSA